MKTASILLSLSMLLLITGCQSGAGRQIVKGAARGAGHGAIEQYGKTEIGKGAAHGGLSSAYQVKDQNDAKRAAEKAAEKAAEE